MLHRQAFFRHELDSHPEQSLHKTKTNHVAHQLKYYFCRIVSKRPFSRHSAVEVPGTRGGVANVEGQA